MSTRNFRIILTLTLLLGLFLRALDLDLRPMHTDEAVKACLVFRPLWEGGVYRYDPDEHHGPTLAYSTLLWGKLTMAGDFGRWSEDRLRLMTVVYGLGLILLLPLLKDGLGETGTLVAALLTAVSPMMVYYSRDYIHEPLLVFFTFLALAALWRYWRKPQLRWMFLAGAAVGLMQATKETFVFNLAAAFGAGVLNWFLFRPAKGIGSPRFRLEHLYPGVFMWLLVSVLFFTSFFANHSGLRDALRTYADWSGRAAGATVHAHGPGFYWERLLAFHAQDGPVWSEALILGLALVAVWAVLARRELGGAHAGFVRFLFFYTLLLAAIYTLLPYKTPWCALGFWHGMILLAGVGAAAVRSVLKAPAVKWATGAIIFVGAGHLAWQAWAMDENYPADPRAPWTYAQTSPDYLNLVGKVRALADVSPDGNGVRINVIAPEDDYYPLPWDLRRFNGIGWWNEVPGYSKLEADDIDAALLAAHLRGRVDPLSRYLMDSVFDKYPEFSREPPQVGGAALKELLLTNLNRVLTGPPLYQEARFDGARLSTNTIVLLHQNPTGLDLVRLNRMLLEDVYTNEISRNLPVEEGYPPITIIASELEGDLDTNQAGKMAGYFELRPGKFLELYAQTNLWAEYVKHNQP